MKKHKIWKNILVFTLVLAMGISVLPVSAFAASEEAQSDLAISTQNEEVADEATTDTGDTNISNAETSEANTSETESNVASVESADTNTAEEPEEEPKEETEIQPEEVNPNEVISLQSTNANDLTISNPRLTADTSDGLGATVKSNSTKGYYARISASSNDPEGVNGVWVGFRFTLKVPDGALKEWAKFTDVSYNWLQDLVTGTKTTTPTYDETTRTWTLEGKYFYDDAAAPLGSSAAKEYSKSISVSTGWLEEGMTLSPTIETWVADKEGDTPHKVDGQTVTVMTEPTLYTEINKLTEAIAGFYSPSTQRFYRKQSEVTDAGVTDAVQGRVYQFATTTSAGTNENPGTALIPNGTPVTVKVPLSVLVNGAVTTDPSQQPILLATHVDTATQSGVNAYKGGLAAGSDITYGGRVKDLISTWYSAVKNESMTDVSYVNNTITVHQAADDAGGSWNGYTTLGSYYQVFVPVPNTDTESTKRVFTVNSPVAENIQHCGSVETKTNTSGGASPIAVGRITNETEDFVGAYSSGFRFGWSSPTTAAIGSGTMDLYPVLYNVSGEARAEINAYDMLIKLDADAYKVETTVSAPRGYQVEGNSYQNGTLTMKYGVLPGGGNWSSDETMNSARKANLTFYDAGSVPEGSTVVAILLQGRDGYQGRGANAPILDNVTITDDATKAGNVYQSCLDVEIWSGDNTPNADGSNFNAVMYPTDGSGYKKATYDADGTYHQDTPNQLNGDSLLLLAYEITGKSYNLNGTNRPTGNDNNTTYDVVSGQRTADIRYEFTLNYLGGEGADDPEQEFELELRIPKNVGNAAVDPGSIRIDADYTAGVTEGAAGIIQGGITPTSIEEAYAGEYGKDWYKVTFTVKGSGVHNVYTSVKLGDALDPDKDVPVSSIAYGITNIYASGRTKKLVSGQAGDINYFVITKSNAAGFQKMAVGGATSDNGEAQYLMTLSAQDQDLTGAFLLDILPFNNDGRGTVLNGSYTVEKPLNLTVRTTNVSVRTDMDIYYTKDDAIQAQPLKTVSDLKGGNVTGDTVTVLGVTWHKATRTDSANNFEYTVDKDTKAIMAAGTVGTNESPTLDLRLQMKDMQTGDKLMNTAGFNAKEFGKPMNSTTVPVTVSERKITGKAWIDANNNGAREDNEKGLSGLTVKLYQGATEITEDESANTYNVVTDTNGNYTFNRLPSSPDAFHVVFSEGTIESYQASTKTAEGVAVDKNSDTTGNPATGTMTSAVSDDVFLLTQAQQSEQKNSLDQKQLDGGFVPIYTVTFNSDGGNYTPDSQKVASNTTAQEPAEPKKAGMIFESWYYDDGARKQTAWSFADPVMGNLDLTAKWIKAKVELEIPSITKEVTTVEDAIPEAVSGASFDFTFTPAKSYGDAVNIPNTTTTATVAGTATADAAESIAADSLGKLIFTEPGTYVFYIKETAGAASGYTYDSKVYVWTIQVEAKTGTLEVASTELKVKENETAEDGTATVVDGITFGNDFQSIHMPYVLPTVTKEFSIDSSARPTNETFSFKIEKAKGTPDKTPMPTNSICEITGEGSVGGTADTGFGQITDFPKEGTYLYKITETKGNIAGYTYDKSTYTLSVKVSYSTDTNEMTAVGTLKKDGADSNAVVFTNEYGVTAVTVDTPNVSKKFAEDSADRPEAKDFTFAITKAEGSAANTPMPKKESMTITDPGTETATVNNPFETVKFTAAGDYRYEIKEMAGTDHGYSYDDNTYLWEVKVVDEDGMLKATSKLTKAGAEVDVAVFENGYSADAVTLEGTKMPAVIKKFTADSAVRSDDKTFEFTLTGSDNAPTPDVNTVTAVGQGAADHFGNITYTKAGVYVYEIAETKGTEPGYTYDDTKYIYTVTVDDQGGALAVIGQNLKKGDTDVTQAVFENSYTVTETTLATEAMPEITKAFTQESDERPSEKNFTFILTATKDAPTVKKMTAEIKGEGLCKADDSFGALNFTAAGVYTYTISEMQGTDSGYTYDNTVYTYEVNVEDKNSILEVTGTKIYKGTGAAKEEMEGQGITFTNAYKAASETYKVPSVTKTIDGNAPDNYVKTFTFEIKAKDADASIPVPMNAEGKQETEISTQGAGVATFGNITYDKAGTYIYEVSEKAGSDMGYTYDEGIYTITVEVTDHDGQLEAVGTVTKGKDDSNSIIFVNQYKTTAVKVDPPVEKRVSGNTPASKETFTFAMKAADAANPMPEGSKDGMKTVTIQGAGKVEFGEYEYTQPGTYSYEISEVAGSNKEYTYDSTVYMLTDLVTDQDGILAVTRTITRADGTMVEGSVFTNKYTKATSGTIGKTTPGATVDKAVKKLVYSIKTGDPKAIGSLVLLFLFSGGAVVLTVKRRRKRH